MMASTSFVILLAACSAHHLLTITSFTQAQGYGMSDANLNFQAYVNQDPHAVASSWMVLRGKVVERIQSLAVYLRHHLAENVVKNPEIVPLINESCPLGLFSAIDALEQLQPWAVQMVDSWGRFPPSGILSGTTTDLGDYDQCMSIQPPKGKPLNQVPLV